MNRRLVAGLVAPAAIAAGASLWIALRPGAAFHAVGPRLVGNDTAYPVWIYGRALPRRARLVLGEPRGVPGVLAVGRAREPEREGVRQRGIGRARGVGSRRAGLDRPLTPP